MKNMGQKMRRESRIDATWCWIASPEFWTELLEWIGERRGAQHYGKQLREAEEHKAERLGMGH
jgi:hypothetical protein